MDIINRRNFIQRLSGAGMALPFPGPLRWFNRPQAGSTVHVFSKHLQFLDYTNLAGAAAGCQFDILHAVIEGGLSWQQSLRLMHPYINTIVVKDFRWEKVDGKWVVRYVPLGEGMVDFRKYFSLLAGYGIRVPISLHFEYPLGGAEHGDAQLTVDQKLVFDAMKKDLRQLRTWLKEAGLNG